MKILVTYAMQGEFVELKLPGMIGGEDVEVGYLRTGIGKVKSAFYLSEIIGQGQPDLVINMGTAGSVNHKVGDILACRRFIDRDMQQLTDMGGEYEVETLPFPELEGYRWLWKEMGVCNSGDSFIETPEHITEDVVDMEAFAQAFVCRAKNIPFIAVKYVSNVIGKEVMLQDDTKLDTIRTGLSDFFDALLQ